MGSSRGHGKTRFLPLHSGTDALIHEYLEAASHGEEDVGVLFRAVRKLSSKDSIS